MIRITDDSGTVTKCILDPYDEELSALEATVRSENWEREVAIHQLNSDLTFPVFTPDGRL